ncbi:hypothetical protein D9M70_553030 [compost metagenome]
MGQVGHLLDQPGNAHRVAEQPGALDHQAALREVLGVATQPGHGCLAFLPAEQHPEREALVLARLLGELPERPQRFLIAHLRRRPVGPEAHGFVGMQPVGANRRHQVAPPQLAGGSRCAGKHARISMGKPR